jgi:hypothetical protein
MGEAASKKFASSGEHKRMSNKQCRGHAGLGRSTPVNISQCKFMESGGVVIDTSLYG